MSRPTIFLIHGAWVTPRCWDHFKSFFEQQGYQVVAPAWPGKDQTVTEQQSQPSEQLRGLGITEIVDYYAGLIQAEAEPPILIGHSFGGLFVQMLLDRGLGRAGIAINSAPPKGVFAMYPRCVWSLRHTILTPGGWKKILRWPAQHFHQAFVHTLPPEEQRQAYDTYVVPETGRIFWQGAFAAFLNVSAVNFKNTHRAPLLLIAGTEDRVVPAIMNQRNYKKYLGSGARTDFKEFPGRTHWIIAQPGWEEVAQYCLDWIYQLGC